jgi:hypothetical protein
LAACTTLVANELEERLGPAEPTRHDQPVVAAAGTPHVQAGPQPHAARAGGATDRQSAAICRSSVAWPHHRLVGERETVLARTRCMDKVFGSGSPPISLDKVWRVTGTTCMPP